MSQYQNGTKLLRRKSHKQPQTLSLGVTKRKPSKQTGLLCARVNLVKLTPAQLPAPALEQYYKLSVRYNRRKQNHLISNLSSSSGDSTCDNLANIQNSENATLQLHHTKRSPVGSSLFPRIENSPLQKEVNALPHNIDSRPVNSFSNVVSQAVYDYFSTETTKSQMTTLPSEQPDEVLSAPKSCTNILIPAQNSTEILQATRPLDPSDQISGTDSSNPQQHVLSACVSLKSCSTITGSAQPITAERSIASTNTANQTSSSTPQAAVTQPQQMLNNLSKKSSSLNLCLGCLPPVQTVTNFTKSAVPVDLRLTNNTAASMKNKQSLHLTSSDRHFSGVQLKANCLFDQQRKDKSSKTFNSLVSSPVARCLSNVVRVHLSPLRPNQLPPHVRIQHIKLQLGVQSKHNHQKKFQGTKSKKIQKKCSGKSCTANKKVSHTQESKSMKDKRDSSKVQKKQKVPLQTWKGNLQATGIQKPKERFTKNGRRVIPSYKIIIEPGTSGECENQPHMLTKNKLAGRNKNNMCINGVKRKAEVINMPRKKLKNSGKTTKKKNKKWLIPEHYRNIKLSEISTISRIKTRYNVAFARWPRIFGGALDIINERIASQNAIWNCL